VLTGEFAVRRVAPGPHTAREVATMLVTSAAIPPYAVMQRVLGEIEHRAADQWTTPLRAVLFDRDGTLVEDVPYNGDPNRVRLVDGAADALQCLREAGIKVGVVTNQSGIARGLVTREQVESVNARIEQLLGPIDTWQLCPHGPDDGCACRKPLPGMVSDACEQLGVAPHEVAVIGDIAADLLAAHAAGARGVLVPNGRTRPDEVQAARHVASTLTDAVDLLLASAS
jgi:HAD superfamily hydrolase (TIGR01662 family)